MEQEIFIKENDPVLNSILYPTSEMSDKDTKSTKDSSMKDGLIINKESYNAIYNNNTINFPKKEFELLLLLASNPQKVFTRVEILSKIWGSNYAPKDSRSLDVHIRMIRKKLNNHFIRTIRGVGYKLKR